MIYDKLIAIICLENTFPKCLFTFFLDCEATCATCSAALATNCLTCAANKFFTAGVGSDGTCTGNSIVIYDKLGALIGVEST